MSTITFEKHTDLRSNFQCDHRFVIQVWCTAIGWADTIHGGRTLAQAEDAAVALSLDETHWVCPDAPKRLRIVSNK